MSAKIKKIKPSQAKALKAHRQATSLQAYRRWKDVEKKGCMKCNTCNLVKPLSEYRKYIKKAGRSYDSWAPSCKECSKLVHKKCIRKKISTVDQKLAQLFNNTKQRCIRDDKVFDLTRQFLITLYNKQAGKCYYTGLDLLPINDECNHQIISIDRVDSNKGYTQDNVVLCCWIINRIKSNLSIEEFIKYCSLVSTNNKYVN